MAAISTTRGTKLVLQVGDGASPEVFTTLCTINASRGVTFNAGTTEERIIDCADPEALAFLSREKDGLSVDVTGSGTSHKQDVARLWDWWKSPDSKNCKLILDDDVVANVITFEGAYHLTSFDLTGDRGAKVQSSLSLSSDGEVTATFGANVGLS